MTPQDKARYDAYAQAWADSTPPITDDQAEEAARILAQSTPAVSAQAS